MHSKVQQPRLKPGLAVLIESRRVYTASLEPGAEITASILQVCFEELRGLIGLSKVIEARASNTIFAA